VEGLIPGTLIIAWQSLQRNDFPAISSRTTNARWHWGQATLIGIRCLVLSGLDDLVHNSPVDICGTKVASGMFERQTFVIDSQQMQQCCMQVVHMNLAVDGEMTNLVRRAPRETGFTPPPARKTVKPRGL
jgi:hypothetical protein